MDITKKSMDIGTSRIGLVAAWYKGMEFLVGYKNMELLVGYKNMELFVA